MTQQLKFKVGFCEFSVHKMQRTCELGIESQLYATFLFKYIMKPKLLWLKNFLAHRQRGKSNLRMKYIEWNWNWLKYAIVDAIVISYDD